MIAPENGPGNLPTKALTWKPMAGGLLSLAAGVFDLLIALSLTIGILAIGTANLITEADIYPMTLSLFTSLLKWMTVFYSVAGLLAVSGGFLAIKRRNWVVALTGAVAASISPWVFFLGIPSLVLTAISRREFH